MNAENIKFGPCVVFIDGVDVGSTLGGVEINIEYQSEPTNYLGYNPNYDVSNVISLVQVSIPFAETTLENMYRAMPWAEKITSVNKQLINLKSKNRPLST